MTKDIKGKVMSGLFWKLMERGSIQVIQFVIQIILARLLIPKDYGLIALVVIFIAISNVFVQDGFYTALIQKKDVDDTDYSSVFYLSIFISTVLYIFLFIVAPLISNFYEEPKLIPVFRILSLSLFFTSLTSIQYAIISRTMQFRKLFFSSMGGVIISGITGITMAYMGFGVWALVWQQLTSYLFNTIVLWFSIKWRPKIVFSFIRVKTLFKYGWKLLLSALLDTGYNNIFGLVIGKIHTSEMLGYYNRGNQFPNLLVANINGSIGSVLFPAMSASQDDKKMVKSIVRRSIVSSAFIIFPAMIGLAACAESLVRLLLTEKWLPCVPFLQILCFSYALWPVHTANLQAIKALGRSDIFLKLELIKKFIGILALLLSIRYGIYVMVIIEALTGFIGTIINAFPNKCLLNYSFKEQWVDILPSLFLSSIMGVVVYLISFIGFNVYLTLIIQITIGVLIYIGLSSIFRIESMVYLIGLLKDLYIKKIKNC